MAGVTTSLILAGIGAAGALAGSKTLGGQEKPGEPPPLPQAPKPDYAAAKAAALAAKRKGAMTKTVYGSPLGLAGTAQVARKTLTGQ